MSKQQEKRKTIRVDHPYQLPHYNRDLWTPKLDFELAYITLYNNNGVATEPCIYDDEFYLPIIAEDSNYAIVYNWYTESDMEYEYNGFILCKKIGIYDNTFDRWDYASIYVFSCASVKPIGWKNIDKVSLKNFLDTLPQWLVNSLDNWS